MYRAFYHWCYSPTNGTLTCWFLQEPSDSQTVAVVPADWRLTTICPAHLKGDPEHISNYRLMNFTSFFYEKCWKVILWEFALINRTSFLIGLDSPIFWPSNECWHAWWIETHFTGRGSTVHISEELLTATPMRYCALRCYVIRPPLLIIFTDNYPDPLESLTLILKNDVK